MDGAEGLGVRVCVVCGAGTKNTQAAIGNINYFPLKVREGQPPMPWSARPAAVRRRLSRA